MNKRQPTSSPGASPKDINMCQVYRFSFHISSIRRRQTDRRTNAKPTHENAVMPLEMVAITLQKPSHRRKK